MRLSKFSYLAERVLDAEFQLEPFRHLYIENFLSEADFTLLTEASEIKVPPQRTTQELIDSLLARGWAIQNFPGCIKSIPEYLKCLETNRWPVDKKRLESFGMAFRLQTERNPRIEELVQYLNSDQFHAALENKFSIMRPNRIQTAIQKYLCGYEISPHPDIRSKCLTYLVNINTDLAAEAAPIHTHLLSFKPDKRFIYEFWKQHVELDTDWVPWEWCQTKKFINKNNSLVMFAPAHDSLHAVKLRYDHLSFQRTQIYGNLWYTDVPFELPKFPYQKLSGLAYSSASELIRVQQGESPPEMRRAKRFVQRFRTWFTSDH